ncbi:MAG: hypothetical protein A2W23_08270 [Planctomycetes bacterium RBG_16_43_13]|nr:MAG: hypothetical protein A2W23_08270 [Planctomycetes bacterium RBG_16_43_13]
MEGTKTQAHITLTRRDLSEHLSREFIGFLSDVDASGIPNDILNLAVELYRKTKPRLSRKIVTALREHLVA